MKLEKQIVSLELAKELKELGVKQESLFHYNKQQITKEIMMQSNKTISVTNEKTVKNRICSAFTVAELGEMLPNRIIGNNNKDVHTLEHWKESGGWYLSYRDSLNKAVCSQSGNTEADARAKMFIYLIKEKLIVLEK